MDEEFAAKMNKFVFLIPLPVLLFGDLAKVDFKEVWNIRFVIFCFVVTFICITIAALVSCIWKDRSIQGEFIQASYRSSAALLGIAFIQNIYGLSLIHISEPTRRTPISYAVFCLKKKKKHVPRR